MMFETSQTQRVDPFMLRKVVVSFGEYNVYNRHKSNCCSHGTFSVKLLMTLFIECSLDECHGTNHRLFDNVRLCK